MFVPNAFAHLLRSTRPTRSTRSPGRTLRLLAPLALLAPPTRSARQGRSENAVKNRWNSAMRRQLNGGLSRRAPSGKTKKDKTKRERAGSGDKGDKPGKQPRKKRSRGKDGKDGKGGGGGGSGSKRKAATTSPGLKLDEYMLLEGPDSVGWGIDGVVTGSDGGVVVDWEKNTTSLPGGTLSGHRSSSSSPSNCSPATAAARAAAGQFTFGGSPQFSIEGSSPHAKSEFETTLDATRASPQQGIWSAWSPPGTAESMQGTMRSTTPLAMSPPPVMGALGQALSPPVPVFTVSGVSTDLHHDITLLTDLATEKENKTVTGDLTAAFGGISKSPAAVAALSAGAVPSIIRAAAEATVASLRAMGGGATASTGTIAGKEKGKGKGAAGAWGVGAGARIAKPSLSMGATSSGGMLEIQCPPPKALAELKTNGKEPGSSTPTFDSTDLSEFTTDWFPQP